MCVCGDGEMEGFDCGCVCVVGKWKGLHCDLAFQKEPEGTEALTMVSQLGWFVTVCGMC